MGTVTFDEETGVEVHPTTRREARAAEAPEPRERRERKPFDYKKGFWIAVAVLVLSHMGNAQPQQQAVQYVPAPAPAVVSDVGQ